jgi:SNF2 family DNA or RNA helicase
MLTARLHVTRSKANHIRVSQTPPQREDLKHALQRIGSPARWIPAEWAWDAPLNPAAVARLDEVAKQFGERIEWAPELKGYAEEHLKREDYEHQTRLAIERLIQDKSIAIEPYVCRPDMPPLRHQDIGYHWSLRVRGVLLAWDMGLGKTKSGADASGGWYRTGQIQPMRPIMVGGKPGVAGGVLIVCPRSMMKTWHDELYQWQNASSLIVYGREAKRKMRLAATPSFYHIVNWEGLKFIEHNEYAGIILDECHRMANNSTQSEKSRNVAQRTQKVIALTGTPISNDLKSIFYPMLAVDGGRSLGPSRAAFLEKFFTVRKNRRGEDEHDPKENAAVEIARAISASTYFLKKTEAIDLPPKTHTPVYLEMTPEQADYYAKLKADALVYIQDAEVTVDQASARMMKLLQVCQGFVLTDDMNEDTRGRHFSDAKTAELMDMLTGPLQGRKVITWCNFKFEIKRLRNALREAGIPHCCVDGDATQAERDAAKESFNRDPNMLIHVRQISMSEGVTLLANESGNPCSNAIYLALNYRMVDLLQSIDRNHRIGQKLPCTYHYLLTENGIDRMVYLRLLEKIKNAEVVHTTGKAWYRELLEAA